MRHNRSGASGAHRADASEKLRLDDDLLVAALRARIGQMRQFAAGMAKVERRRLGRALDKYALYAV